MNSSNNNRKKVDVILFVGANKSESDVNLNSWLQQDYDNYELLIIASSAQNTSSYLKGITHLHKNVKLICQKSSDPFEVLTYTDSDYILYADSNDFYPINYISAMIAKIDNSVVCISGSAILFPDKECDLLNSSIGFELQDTSTCGKEFFLNYSNFWGTYFLGNKLIKFDAAKKAYDIIKREFPLRKYETNLYSYHLFFSAVILSESDAIKKCDDVNVIVNWNEYDNKIRSYSFEYIRVFKNIKKVFEKIEKLYIFNDAEIQKFDTVKSNFITRYWWRTNWVLDPAKKENILLQMSDYFDENISYEYKNDFENSNCIINSLSLDKDIYLPDKMTAAQEDKKINIYVSMHKPSFVPNNKHLKPIQVGAALADERFDGVIHDDEGINISEKNKRYCELTAQYWAWKNDTNADFYGFWHYRRYFCFNPQKKADVWGNVDIKNLTPKLIKELMLTEEDIRKATDLYDIIVPEEWVCNEGSGEMTVYQHWCKHFNPNDIQVMMDVIHEKYPEYDKSVLNMLFSNSAPFCNLFIMKRDLFEEYSRFCFDVLEEVENRVDHESYNVERYRTMGHLAERLVGIFVNYIENTRPDISIMHMPTVLIRDTRPKAYIKPIETDKKTVTLTLACDNKFVPYTSVLLQSINDNSSTEYFYDIILMHKDISEVNQQKLKSIFDDCDNISLRFADVTKNFENHLDLHIDRHLSLETYFRFIIMDIMPEYEKVLYLDCDMVVNQDISALYFTDLEGHAIGATRDLDFIASYQEPSRHTMYDEKIMKYININSAEDYFQAGVLLLNLKKISKLYKTEDLFDQATYRNWYYHDQDVLNSLFTGDVYYLDQKWNVLTMLEPNSERSRLFKEYLFAKYSENYNNARKNIGIIHFAGVPKPWLDPRCDLSLYFWKYAKKSPYYEELLNKLNSGYMLPFGSIIFTGNHIASENLGCDLFDIKILNNAWSEVYSVVDFVFLSEHNRTEITKGTLFITASVLPSENGNTYIRMNKFRFDNCDYDYMFRDNISYYITDNKTIRIRARQTAQYEGFSWRIRELQSREIEKPTVEILNEGFIDSVVHL